MHEQVQVVRHAAGAGGGGCQHELQHKKSGHHQIQSCGGGAGEPAGAAATRDRCHRHRHSIHAGAASLAIYLAASSYSTDRFDGENN